MNTPNQHTRTPRAGNSDVNIDVTSTQARQDSDKSDLTTSQDAQREDLTVQPDNS